jgi:hypothetical protein
MVKTINRDEPVPLFFHLSRRRERLKPFPDVVAEDP